MAATATRTFRQHGLIPVFPSTAKRMNVQLPPSVTYPAGTVLGEVTGNNEVQTITLATGGTLGGTYTLSFGGETTGAIAFNASAATVQTALEGLASIGPSNVAVTGTTPGTSGGTLTVTFQNFLGRANVPQMTLGNGSLTGDSGSAVTTATGGSAGSRGNNELVAVKITGTSLGGTFTLTFGGKTTTNINYNATAADVQAALEALSTVGIGGVQVYTGSALGASGGTLLVNFTGANALSNVGSLTATTTNLTGSGPGSTITKIFDGVATTPGTLFSAYAYGNTNGTQIPRCVLEFDCCTDANGNITFGNVSTGDEHGATFPAAPAFISGDFYTQDLVQFGAGHIDDNAVNILGRLIEGTVVNGIVRING